MSCKRKPRLRSGEIEAQVKLRLRKGRVEAARDKKIVEGDTNKQESTLDYTNILGRKYRIWI